MRKWAIIFLTVFIAVLFSITAAMQHHLLWMASACVVLAMLGWVVLRLDWMHYLLLLIAITLPFSVEIPFIGNSMLRVPGEPLIMLAAFVFATELLVSRFRVLKSRLSGEWLWVMPLVASFILTIPFSTMLMVSLKFSFINLLYILVFFALLSQELKRKPELFLRMIFLYSLGLLLVLCWGIYRLWQWEWNPVVMRGVFHPFFNDHTIFGASAALVGALWLGSLPEAENKSTGLLHIFFAVVLFSTVLFSTSRAAFLSLFVFAGVWLVLISGIRFRYMAGMLAVVLLLGFFMRGPVLERVGRVEVLSYDSHAGLLERTQSVANVSTDASNIERLNRWIAAWRMFKEKPFTGFGPGTWQFAYIPYQEPALENHLTVTNLWDPPEGSGGTAHSEYLLALSEMGFAGLLGWLLILGRLGYLAMKKSRFHPNRRLIIAAMAALSTYFFHAHFNNFLTTDKFAFLFWGTMAWLVALYHEKNTSPGQL